MVFADQLSCHFIFLRHSFHHLCLQTSYFPRQYAPWGQDLIHYFSLEALSMDWHLEVLYRIAVKCLKEKWIYESFKPSSNATHALKPSVSSFDWKNTPSSSQPLQLFILFTCYLWYSHLCVYLLYFPYWNDFIKGRVPIVLIFDSTNKST